MEPTTRSLPKNAYRPLEKGEKYVPYVTADQIIPEVTTRSVVTGVIMAAVFTFATAYSGLKAGQVFEAAIPVAILAIGLGKFFRRKNTVLENVIIQSIGACSGVVVAGAIFTLPALFMLQLNPGFLTIFLASLLGGILGIIFLVPLRRYFVADQHGQLPFPEATATTEILVTGEKAGNQAWILVRSMIIGGLFDFFGDVLRIWGSHFESVQVAGGKWLADKFKLVFRMDTTAFFVGLGYIIGLRYAAVLCAGSFLSWFVIVPIFGYVQTHFTAAGSAAWLDTPQAIFGQSARLIGVGAIAAAGLLGIIKNFKIIVSSFGVGFKGLLSQQTAAEQNERTNLDLPKPLMMIILGLTLLAILLFFIWVTGTVSIALVGLAIAFFISFLFTTVAARAIAIVGTNPVSGMTLVTLIIGSVILVKCGLSGNSGMMVALIIGSVVCTALSVAGGFITDLKIGYWLGSTPRNQQRFKFLGVAVAALSVGAAIFLIDSTLHFLIPDPVTGQMIPNPAVPAPQANVMRSVITTLMDPNAVIPWLMYGIGILVTLVLEMARVPALAFALGMYLPIELNTPLVVGGFIGYLLMKSTPDKELGEARFQRGTLIASGLLAGAALVGVFGALLRGIDVDMIDGQPIHLLESIWRSMDVQDIPGQAARFLTGGFETGNIVGLLLFLGVAVYVYLDGRRATKNN